MSCILLRAHPLTAAISRASTRYARRLVTSLLVQGETSASPERLLLKAILLPSARRRHLVGALVRRIVGCRRHGVVRRLTWVRWPPSSRSQGFRLALWTGVGTVSGALKDELCAVGLPVGVQLRIGMVSFATGASSPVSAFEPSFTSSGQSYHDLTAARAGPSRPARLRFSLVCPRVCQGRSRIDPVAPVES